MLTAPIEQSFIGGFLEANSTKIPTVNYVISLRIAIAIYCSHGMYWGCAGGVLGVCWGCEPNNAFYIWCNNFPTGIFGITSVEPIEPKFAVQFLTNRFTAQLLFTYVGNSEKKQKIARAIPLVGLVWFWNVVSFSSGIPTGLWPVGWRWFSPSFALAPTNQTVIAHVI